MATPRNPGDSGPTGPVPADNQPGHHPETEQDRPDLDAFARKLSIAPDPPEDREMLAGEQMPDPSDLGVAAQVALVHRIGRLGVMLGVAVVVRAAEAVASNGRAVLERLDVDAVEEVDLRELPQDPR